MWSDAARTSSIQVRGTGAASPPGGGGGGSPGAGGGAPGGNVASQGAMLQAALNARAKGGPTRAGRGGPQHSRTTYKGSDNGPAAHQTGVNAISRRMAGAGDAHFITGYYANVLPVV